MPRSALTSIAAAIRLAARPGGVTVRDLESATGLTRSQANKILLGLERELILAGDSPARAGASRGAWARTWRLEIATGKK